MLAGKIAEVSTVHNVFCNFPMAGDNVFHMWYNMSNDKFLRTLRRFGRRPLRLP